MQVLQLPVFVLQITSLAPPEQWVGDAGSAGVCGRHGTRRTGALFDATTGSYKTPQEFKPSRCANHHATITPLQCLMVVDFNFQTTGTNAPPRP